MKLKKFTAENNQKVIAKIHQMLGPEALIYSTRTTDTGVEMLVALPSDNDAVNDIQEVNVAQNEMIKQLDVRIQELNNNLKELTQRMNDHFEKTLEVVSAKSKRQSSSLLNSLCFTNVFENLNIGLQILLFGVKNQFKQNRIAKSYSRYI